MRGDELPGLTPDDAFTEIGLTWPQCPYCLVELERWPERKTQCRSCGRPIHVRKRPLDECRVLLREDQLNELEEEWRIDYEIKTKAERIPSPELIARVEQDQAYREAHPVLAFFGAAVFFICRWVRDRRR